MVLIKFKGFVLGILFILLAFGDISIAYTQQALEKTAVGMGNGFTMNGGNVASVDQEFLDGVPTAAASAKNKKLGGRKVLVDENVLNNKEMMMKQEGPNGEASNKISGLGKNASAKSLESYQESTTDQNNRSKLEPKKLNSARMMKSPVIEPVDDLPKTNQLNSQEYYFQESDHDDTLQKTESQKLLETANEIVNLMQRDYPGMGRPRRKPPINNRYDPLDENHIKP